MINIGGQRIANLLPNGLIVTRAGKRATGKVLYLTFDDGPHEQFTKPILEILNANDARATFFCIGNNLSRNRALASQLVADGHLLANHSQAHQSFRTLSLKDQVREANECNQLISDIQQGDSRIFRAPQGILSLPLLFALKRQAWKIVHWSYDSMDYVKMSLDDHIKRFEQNPVIPGDIVLFHDDNQITVDLLALLLPEWKEAGYRFETVNALVN